MLSRDKWPIAARSMLHHIDITVVYCSEANARALLQS